MKINKKVILIIIAVIALICAIIFAINLLVFKAAVDGTPKMSFLDYKNQVKPNELIKSDLKFYLAFEPIANYKERVFEYQFKDGEGKLIEVKDTNIVNEATNSKNAKTNKLYTENQLKGESKIGNKKLEWISENENFGGVKVDSNILIGGGKKNMYPAISFVSSIKTAEWLSKDLVILNTENIALKKLKYDCREKNKFSLINSCDESNFFNNSEYNQIELDFKKKFELFYYFCDSCNHESLIRNSVILLDVKTKKWSELTPGDYVYVKAQ